MINFYEEFSAYITCALWSSTDDDGEPLDVLYDRDDINGYLLVTLSDEFQDFLDRASRADLELWQRELGTGAIGHDFWLTRNHHGAGFWDRFYSRDEREEIGRRLTDIAQSFGECYLYVGDDGRIYA